MNNTPDSLKKPCQANASGTKEDKEIINSESEALQMFKKHFADWLEMPGYLETTTDLAIPSDAGKTLNQSVELARDKIYETPGATERQKIEADRQLLGNIFGSSDGVEHRLVAYGFKPVSDACLYFYDISSYDEHFGPIEPICLNGESVYIGNIQYPDVEFAETVFAHLQELERRTPPKHGYASNHGYIYNRSAVIKVVKQNTVVLEALGYDTNKKADEVVSDVFGSGTDPVAESILKGYPPASAIAFYLEYYPGDLGADYAVWGAAAAARTGDKYAREKGYWRSLEKILTKEQLEVARALAAYDGDFRAIDLGTNNLDYIEETPRNEHVQQAWELSGIRSYLDSMLKRMYIDASVIKWRM